MTKPKLPTETEDSAPNVGPRHQAEPELDTEIVKDLEVEGDADQIRGGRCAKVGDYTTPTINL